MIRLTLFMKAVSFSFVVLSIQGCGESGLSKSKAKNIIEPLFKEYYDCPIPQKLHFTFKAPRLYRNVLVAKKLGLADVTQTGSDIGPLGWGSTVEKPKMGSIFTVALTEKGRSTPTMKSQNGITLFLLGTRTIDDVVEIKKESEGTIYTVLFSGTVEFNELGKQSLAIWKDLFGQTLKEKSKYRYRASISYDSFLKKYVVKSIKFSPWEKEEWLNTSWIEDAEGSRMIVTK